MNNEKDQPEPDDRGEGTCASRVQNDVHLGFVEPIETTEQLGRLAHRSPNYEDWDGGQVGGCPSLLNPQHVPDTPLCPQCETIMNFLCQIYAPVDEYEDRAFHRSLYVFACSNSNCQNQNTARVYRCQLPQDNPYFPTDPTTASPEVVSDWNQHIPETHGVHLCQLCGLRGKYKCPLQQLFFCSKQHQKEYKKYVFDKVQNGEAPSELPSVFPVAELAVEGETVTEASDDDVGERNTLFKTSKNHDDEEDSDAELEQTDLNRMTGKKGTVEHDRFTQTFMQRIKSQPDQALRYARWKDIAHDASTSKVGSGVLWIREDYQPSEIPDCPYCGSPRRFEFQIMPQMLDHINRNTTAVVDEETASTYQQYKTALQQVEDLIREAPPEAIPPALVEQKERAAAQMRQYLLQQRKSTMEFGVIAVYTCTNSCGSMEDLSNSAVEAGGDNKNLAYREEFAWRQPCLDLS